MTTIQRYILLAFLLTIVSFQNCAQVDNSLESSSQSSQNHLPGSIFSGVNENQQLCQVDPRTGIQYCTTLPSIDRTNIFDSNRRILQNTDAATGVTLNTIEVYGDFSSANVNGETDPNKMLYTATAYNGGNAIVDGITIGYCVPLVVYESTTLIKLQVPTWDYNTSCQYFISHKHVNAARTGSFSVGPDFQINSITNLGLGDDSIDPRSGAVRSKNLLFLKMNGIFKNFQSTDNRQAVTLYCNKNGSPFIGGYSVFAGSQTEESFEVGVNPDIAGSSCRFGLYDQRSRPTLILMDVNHDMSSVGINLPVSVPETSQPNQGTIGGTPVVPPPSVTRIDYAGIDPDSGMAYIVIWGTNLAQGTPAISTVTMDCASISLSGYTYNYISEGQINGAFLPLHETTNCKVTVEVNGQSSVGYVTVLVNPN